VTICDGLLIYAKKAFTVVLMAGVRGVPLLGNCLAAGQSIFIDRGQKGGNSKLISEGIQNHGIAPLAIAPEGKLSNGTVVYKFLTGGFLTDEESQALAIRYYRPFPWVGSTISWLVPTFKEWIWLAFSSPGYIAEVTCLPPWTKGELADKTPEERAKIAQLAIANSLGTLAVSRSTKELFQGTKED
jgi:1-acyl-sn-glycerol-3-phosphate acyltransferase